jgi:hypothetical protein
MRRDDGIKRAARHAEIDGSIVWGVKALGH